MVDNDYPFPHLVPKDTGLGACILSGFAGCKAEVYPQKILLKAFPTAKRLGKERANRAAINDKHCFCLYMSEVIPDFDMEPIVLAIAPYVTWWYVERISGSLIYELTIVVTREGRKIMLRYADDIDTALSALYRLEA